jgi:hypothetical protein
MRNNMRNNIKNRPWVEKFENGEYLRDYKGYKSILIAGPYSENLGIGEEKYAHCVDFYSGIGDVDWWIKSELDKLSENEKIELEWICKYKTYLKNEIITYEKIKLIADFYSCENFHIHRVGDKKIIELIKHLGVFYDDIYNGSKNCNNEKTIEFKNNGNLFSVLSFEDYKMLKD